MRIAEDIREQEIGVAADLRLAVETGARVVQVHLAARIEPGELACAQIINRPRALILGPSRQEGPELVVALCHVPLLSLCRRLIRAVRLDHVEYPV